MTSHVSLNSVSQRILCWAFSKIYRKWLWTFGYEVGEAPLRPIRVKGWRTALCEYGGVKRVTITPCFWIFK